MDHCEKDDVAGCMAAAAAQGHWQPSSVLSSARCLAERSDLLFPCKNMNGEESESTPASILSDFLIFFPALKNTTPGTVPVVEAPNAPLVVDAPNAPLVVEAPIAPLVVAPNAPPLVVIPRPVVVAPGKPVEPPIPVVVIPN